IVDDARRHRSGVDDGSTAPVFDKLLAKYLCNIEYASQVDINYLTPLLQGGLDGPLLGDNTRIIEKQFHRARPAPGIVYSTLDEVLIGYVDEARENPPTRLRL